MITWVTFDMCHRRRSRPTTTSSPPTDTTSQPPWTKPTSATSCAHLTAATPWRWRGQCLVETSTPGPSSQYQLLTHYLQHQSRLPGHWNMKVNNHQHPHCLMPMAQKLLPGGPHFLPTTDGAITSMPSTTFGSDFLTSSPCSLNIQVLHSAHRGRQFSSCGGCSGLQLQTQPHQDNTAQGSRRPMNLVLLGLC